MIENKGEIMGHKGVSKRKPKKSSSFSNTNTAHTREAPSVQSLVKDNDALINRGSTNPPAGSNKKHKKGK
jgi:hypothetical protein